jgi:hypothetical protein
MRDGKLGVEEVVEPSAMPPAKNGSMRNSPQATAAAFLLRALADGAHPVTELDHGARSSGLVGMEFIGQNRAFRTARKHLGIIAFQQARRWHWSLPQAPSCSTPDGPAGMAATPADRSIATSEPTEGVAVHADKSVRRDPVDPTEDAVTRWAEGVAKLDHSQRPHGVPALRWQTFISDAQKFMASIWPTRAAILGWTAEEVFGCDPKRPTEQREKLGLVWCCLGGLVTELHGDGATISCGTSERYHQRRRVETSVVRLPWQ